MAQHTPGPWVLERRPEYQGFAHLVGGWIVADGELIAEVRGAVEIDGREHTSNLANARLIAAAPKLLFALKLCIQRIERPSLSPDANVVLECALDALSKATSHE